MTERIEVTVTDIAEFVQHHSCHRRFKLKMLSRTPGWFETVGLDKAATERIDPVLATVGKGAEEQWAAALQRTGFIELCPPQTREDQLWGIPWERFAEAAAGLPEGQLAFTREVRIKGDVGAFNLRGRIDFVLVLWQEGAPVLRLVECKAARKDKTYHRIQAIIYWVLVRGLLEGEPLAMGGRVIECDEHQCAVARIDVESNRIQPMLGVEPFKHVHVYESDVCNLMAEGGVLEGLARAELDSLPYQLEPKCDGCRFSPQCFAHSTRQRRLELIGLTPSQRLALEAQQINTLDALADLDPRSPRAEEIRQDPTFIGDIETLRVRARVRRDAIELPLDTFPEAIPLPRAGAGHLPEHIHEGRPLVRVFLSVSTDYAENRLGALSAHVTTSVGRIETPFVRTDDGISRPVPRTVERLHANLRKQHEGRTHRGVQGTNVVELQRMPWSGEQTLDAQTERVFLFGFIRRLFDAIRLEAGRPEASVHFYVWSSSELRQLLEGCARAGNDLLNSVRHLLGCREQLEQLIYSSLQTEVLQRYALGWTSTGLVTACASSWSGRRYHWQRQVGSGTVDLTRVFAHGIFDFQAEHEGQTFEERARFFDNLPAAYWRAHWGTLTGLLDNDQMSRWEGEAARYEAAAAPLVLEHYLLARVHALRFIEEQIGPRNDSITKPPLPLGDLSSFRLSTSNAAEASVDFLKLDHHVAYSDWAQRHLLPPMLRVHQGRSLLLRDLRVVDGSQTKLTGVVDTEAIGLSLEVLRARVSYESGSFVRLSPVSRAPHQSQRFEELVRSGRTCVIEALDWETGETRLSVIPTSRKRRDHQRYLLTSDTFRDGSVFARGTLDESISDYTSGRVEKRLTTRRDDGLLKGHHAVRWFDPTAPAIPPRSPLPEDTRAMLKTVLEALRMEGQHPVLPVRINIVLEGLEHRVQLVQGPPGTGKTMLSAVAILTRILASRAAGDMVLISSNTHMAVDTLLERLVSLLPDFRAATHQAGVEFPDVCVAKVHSQKGEDVGGVLAVSASSCKRRLDELRRGAVVIAGGTTGGILKMVTALNATKDHRELSDGFQVPLLIIDEASMLVFASFLALATLVREDGAILLAGDHRQLAPIIAHDWASDDRPPAIAYQPHVSAFQAIVGLFDQLGEQAGGRISRRGLQVTYRLPPAIRNLISPVYELDAIELSGPAHEMLWGLPADPERDSWRAIWNSGRSLFLVTHNECASRDHNPLEIEIVQQILAAGRDLAPPDSVAVVTPYRAQRASLKTALEGEPSVALADTVERLQGGERPSIIFTTAISDPVAVAQSADFILNLNRSNVAFSRPKERLIIVCARSLLDHIPTEVEHYDNAVIWKLLRQTCDLELGRFEFDGHAVRLMTPQGDI